MRQLYRACKGQRDHDSSRPGYRNGQLHRAIAEHGLVVERIDNGDKAFHGHDNQVVSADEGGHLHQRRESRENHIEATRVAEDVDDEDERRVPEHHHRSRDVGHQHAGENEVGLGPESRRHSDGDQCEPVSAQVAYIQSE